MHTYIYIYLWDICIYIYIYVSCIMHVFFGNMLMLCICPCDTDDVIIHFQTRRKEACHLASCLLPCRCKYRRHQLKQPCQL